MQPDRLLTVVMIARVQSAFGAGVQRFGTHILLWRGHDVVEALVVLTQMDVPLAENGHYLVLAALASS